MHTWQIELRDVGEGRMSAKLRVRAPNLTRAKQVTIRECRKYAPLANLFLEARGNCLYTLVAGLQDMGLVRITQLSPSDKGTSEGLPGNTTN